jgi:hypothetical protein
VTPVKNQGPGCNLSLAFATTGLVEGAFAVHTGTLDSLAEQQLVDCTTSCGGVGTAAGCGSSGCAQIGCIASYLATHGSCSEQSYPYTDSFGSCKPCTPVVLVGPTAAWIRLTPGSESGILGALASGPVLARLEIGSQGATLPAYANYQSGTFSPPPTDDSVVQWVLIVGYSSQYFIVKNSLGTAWGSSGYMYLARGANALGIANFAYALQLTGVPTGGACIRPGGACQEMGAAACTTANGGFEGVGTFCPTPCAGAVAFAVPGLSRPGMVTLGILLYLAGAALLLRLRNVG